MIFNLNGRTKGWSKLFVMVAVVMILATLCTMGAFSQNIGLISLAKVTASHPNTEKINQLNQQLRTELQTRQEKLNQEGKGLEETALLKLEEKFNTEWEPVKQKLLTQMQALQAERNSDIVQAIKSVGEKGSYQVIINSEVPVIAGNDINEYPIILYGGTNVTQDVIAELGKIVASN